VARTDSGGAVIEREVYTPFGALNLLQNERVGEEGFTGHVRDGSGVNYMKARYYMARSSRFLSPDPVGFAQGGPAYFNRYAYVHNDPVNKTDPTGEFAQFAVKFAIDVALEAGIQYATTGSVDVGSAVKDAATGLVNPAKTLERAKDLAKVAGAAAGAAKGGLKNSDLVVRGGTNKPGGGISPEGIAKGTGTHPEGPTGFSAQAKPGASLCDFCGNIKNDQVGVTTVGDVRAAGGDVVQTSGKGNHVTVTGLTPEKASGLLSPPVQNPVPKDLRQ
jgi:hypothetical protein